MKVTGVKPPPPPREIQMTFPASEGWAVLAALRDYAAGHPDAAHVEHWRQWARDLDRELSRP